MFQYTCGFDSCQKLTSFANGDCWYCLQHLCDEHIAAEFHPCLFPGADIDKIMADAYAADYAKISVVLKTLDIATFAEAHKPGHRLVNTLILDAKELGKGGCHVMVPLEFDDGTKWMARVRQEDVPDEGLKEITLMRTQGEMDFLVYLTDVVGVKVPAVRSALNGNGGAYFYLTDRVPGKSYANPFWTNLPRELVSRVIEEMAQFFVKISEHPLRGVGSIQRDAVTGEWTVGPFINHREISRTAPHYPEAFETAADKWKWVFDQKLTHIEADHIWTDQKEKARVVWTWIRDAVATYAPFAEKDQPTYVMHEDFKGDTIMVDDEGLTGIIDWECASLAYKCEAFAPPIALMEGSGVFFGNDDFSSYELELRDNYLKLGRPDLAECVEKGKLSQRLWCLNMHADAWQEMRQLKSLAGLLDLEWEWNSMEDFVQAQLSKSK